MTLLEHVVTYSNSSQKRKMEIIGLIPMRDHQMMPSLCSVTELLMKLVYMPKKQ